MSPLTQLSPLTQVHSPAAPVRADRGRLHCPRIHILTLSSIITFPAGTSKNVQKCERPVDKIHRPSSSFIIDIIMIDFILINML